MKTGTLRQRFILSASKLPANTSYNVLVDGVQTETVTSNKKGRLSIRDLNVDLLNVQTVSLVTVADGTEAATAHF
jgi:hypothetical protein